MTRVIPLSFGGKIVIKNSERCPECDARPKAVESKERDPDADPYLISGEPEGSYYRCGLCGHEWPIVM